MKNLCLQFPSLTTLSIAEPQLKQLFTAFSQLHQLVHLKLNLFLSENRSEELRPHIQLNSVRALDLDLGISSHSHIQWLKLQWAQPNLQAIPFRYFFCFSCSVNLSK